MKPGRRARRDWWVIAKREFLERVRSKWFIIGTVLGPIFMVAMILVPALLARAGNDHVRIRVVDHSAQLGPLLVKGFEAKGWQAELAPTEVGLLARIADDTIDGFLTIPADILADGEIVYQGDNATSQGVQLDLQMVLYAVVQPLRGAQVGVTPAQYARVVAPVRFSAKHTTGQGGGTSGMATFFVGYAVMFILFMAILLYAVNVMRSVVQEKTSRIVELMVAAAKPRALMAGKILGVGAVGLVQLAVWLGMAYLTMTYRDSMLSMLGAGGQGSSIPPLRLAEVGVILAYFLLGYFFYASIYAAVGAMVSSEEEAQQAQTPVSLLMIVPMACVNLVSNDPRGTTASVLTLIPFSSPVLMPMRYLLGGATPTQLAVSLVILAGSTAVVVGLAARIYRVGILMVGKRPSLRELLRWLRY